MAYGLKYWFQFKDIHRTHPAKWKVDILFRDFTGDAIEIKTPGEVPLTFTAGTQGDDKFEPILGSEANLEIVITNEDILKPEDFISIDETEALVQIYKNGSIYWKGYVKQDFIQYAYTFRRTL